MAKLQKRDDNWVDGLRGIASFVVVTGHLCAAFAPFLHSPSLTAESGPSLFQLPFLRLCVGGRAAVAFFFIVTGYVNSLNPIKNASANNMETALVNLARSTFTRSGRLVVPTSIAAIVAWVFCQLGAFELARVCDSSWIRMVAKERGPTVYLALKGLFRNMLFFWHTGGDTYDPTHWSIVNFLKGSMRIYVTLLGTSFVGTKSRVAVMLGLYAFCWATGDYITGINIYTGMMLAQLQVSYGSRATSMLPRPLPALLIIIGLFICGYPQHNHEWMTWSATMKQVGLATTPEKTVEYIGRYWVNIGMTILMTGIFFSRNARRVLTLPLFNFLGRVSFPVYLLHNTLIRSLMVWMVYSGNVSKTDLTQNNEEGKVVNHVAAAGRGTFVFALPVFYGTLYATAYMWSLHVDPRCVRVVNWFKEKMFKEDQLGSGEQVNKPIPLTAIA